MPLITAYGCVAVVFFLSGIIAWKFADYASNQTDFKTRIDMIHSKIARRAMASNQPEVKRRIDEIHYNSKIARRAMEFENETKY